MTAPALLERSSRIDAWPPSRRAMYAAACAEHALSVMPRDAVHDLVERLATLAWGAAAGEPPPEDELARCTRTVASYPATEDDHTFEACGVARQLLGVLARPPTFTGHPSFWVTGVAYHAGNVVDVLADQLDPQEARPDFDPIGGPAPTPTGERERDWQRRLYEALDRLTGPQAEVAVRELLAEPIVLAPRPRGDSRAAWRP